MEQARPNADSKSGRAMITSEIKLTHRPRGAIEAWQYRGQKFEHWPDWLRSYYLANPRTDPNKARRFNWALRDDEGYFWRWMRPELFADRYETITAGNNGQD
jgi:hypothetical protein